MKKVILTGLRNEVDMRTGQTTAFGLIFNDGALHIPVTQEVMKEVIAYAFGEIRGVDEGEAAPSEPQEPARTEDPNEMQEVAPEDDIPQM